jgi:hypothetical protein
MSNESKPSSMDKVEDASLSKADDYQVDKVDQVDVTPDQMTDNSRKNALSKREIMEQLSRERFPWDE